MTETGYTLSDINPEEMKRVVYVLETANRKFFEDEEEGAKYFGFDEEDLKLVQSFLKDYWKAVGEIS
jgi:hypothetical protein